MYHVMVRESFENCLYHLDGDKNYVIEIDFVCFFGKLISRSLSVLC